MEEVVDHSVAQRKFQLILMGVFAASALLVASLGIYAVVGLAAGVVIALFAGRAIRGLLFGIQPTDSLTLVGVAMVLLVVCALDCFILARRAAGTDPIATLRRVVADL